jgi:hypothetical protein
MPKDAPHLLSYASQRPRGARQRLAGVFTIMAILFGVPSLSIGFSCLSQGLRLTNPGARLEAFMLSTVGLGIGGVCTAAALQWGRDWYRRPGSR